MQINSKEDLLEYLRQSLGLERVAYWIGGIIDQNVESNCSYKRAEQIGYEDFYEGTLLDSELGGFIKLNIKKKEIFEILEQIYYGENPTGLFV